MNILVSGSLVYDRIMDFPGYFKEHILPDKIHNLNVSFLINGLKENFGGTAGNIAYNLALLGERPVVLSCAGKDFEPYEKWLVKNKIEIKEIKKLRNLLTAGAYIMTDKADNQITGFNPGAMFTARGSFNKLYLKNSLAIISPGNLKDIENYANIYKKNKVRYIFDPGQSITALSAKTLKSCMTGAEIMIGNDYEIELIMEKTGWTNKQITGKINVLIITKGEKGSEVFFNADSCGLRRGLMRTNAKNYRKIRRIIIPAAKPKKVVDPTGAGDAYRAGLIKGIVSGFNIVKSAKLASAVASFAVEEYGGQGHKPTLKEIEKRMKIKL